MKAWKERHERERMVLPFTRHFLLFVVVGFRYAHIVVAGYWRVVLMSKVSTCNRPVVVSVDDGKLELLSC